MKMRECNECINADLCKYADTDVPVEIFDIPNIWNLDIYCTRFTINGEKLIEYPDGCLGCISECAETCEKDAEDCETCEGPNVEEEKPAEEPAPKPVEKPKKEKSKPDSKKATNGTKKKDKIESKPENVTIIPMSDLQKKELERLTKPVEADWQGHHPIDSYEKPDVAIEDENKSLSKYPARKGISPTNKLTQETIDRVISLYESGNLKPLEIAKKIGIGKSSVYRILKENMGVK